MTRSSSCLGVVATALILTAPTSAQQPAIEVKVVNYQQLGDTVSQFKGKVIVVDFWATTCLPCMKEFPHLVELHKKYAKDGFVAISVSVDDPKDAETLPKVKGFLKRQGATFTNLVLDEPPQVWQEKLRTEGVPCVYVFNRERKIYKKYGDGVDYTEVEKDVQRLLKEK